MKDDHTWRQSKSRIETLSILSRDDGAFEYELCSHLEDNKLSNQKKLLVPMFLFFAVAIWQDNWGFCILPFR